MLAVIYASCLALTLAAPQKASAVYESAIAKYAAGDRDAAFAALSQVAHADVSAEVETDVVAAQSRQGNAGARQRLEVIAVLHTDYVMSRDLRPKDAQFQIEVARLALAIYRGSIGHDSPGHFEQDQPRAREFLPHWYALATSVLLSYFADQNAKSLIDDGVRLFPDDQSLLFWRGVVMQFSAVWVGVRPIGSKAQASSGISPRSASGAAMLTVTSLWSPVEDAFRHVVQKDPDRFGAHLHHGYALYALRKDDDAKAEYELARDRSDDPSVVYVADLLLARLEEDHHDLIAATRDYEHALATIPRAQNAYIGLGSIALRLGNAQRAQEWTEQLAAIPANRRVRDPWWAFQTTRVPVADLEWLRAAVSR